MSVRTKLLLAMGGIAVALVVPAAYGLSQLRAVEQIAVRLQGRHAAAQVAIADLQGLTHRAERLGRQYVALGESSTGDSLRSVFRSAAEPVTRLKNAGYEGGADSLSWKLEEARSEAGTLYRLVRVGKRDSATTSFQQFASALTAIRRQAQAVAAVVDRRSTTAAGRASQIARDATIITAICMAVGILLAIGLALAITRDLTAPLNRLRLAAKAVAEGRYSQDGDLEVERSDELGMVSRAFALMRGRLSELNELRADLLGATSHRLKTPINVILGYTEMLQDHAEDSLGKEGQKHLRAIEAQVGELRERVDRLLKVSRIEANNFKIAPEPVPVRPLFRELREIFEPLAQQQEVTLSLHLDSNLPETVKADPDRLRDDVIGNLVENAFKHTKVGDTISIHVQLGQEMDILGDEGQASAAIGSLRNRSAEPVDGDKTGESAGSKAEKQTDLVENQWSIAVKDTGAGIPEDELKRVFDRYYKVRDDGDGVGLGLSVARRVVKAHGGRIWAESEIGKGSIFHVTLPVHGRPQGHA